MSDKNLDTKKQKRVKTLVKYNPEQTSPERTSKYLRVMWRNKFRYPKIIHRFEGYYNTSI